MIVLIPKVSTGGSHEPFPQAALSLLSLAGQGSHGDPPRHPCRVAGGSGVFPSEAAATAVRDPVRAGEGFGAVCWGATSLP